MHVISGTAITQTRKLSNLNLKVFFRVIWPKQPIDQLYKAFYKEQFNSREAEDRLAIKGDFALDINNIVGCVCVCLLSVSPTEFSTCLLVFVYI